MIVRLAALLLLAALAGCSTSSNKLGKDAAKLLEFKQTAKFDVRWRADIGGAGNNILQPALMTDAVYAANAKGKLFKLQRVSGKRLWRVKSGFTISAGVGAGGTLAEGRAERDRHPQHRHRRRDRDGHARRPGRRAGDGCDECLFLERRPAGADHRRDHRAVAAADRERVADLGDHRAGAAGTAKHFMRFGAGCRF